MFQTDRIIPWFQFAVYFARQHSNCRNFGQTGKRLRQTGLIGMPRLIQCRKSAANARRKGISQGEQMKATIRHEIKSSRAATLYKFFITEMEAKIEGFGFALRMA